MSKLLTHDLEQDETETGHSRLTCHTCGVTVVRQPWMTGDKWIEAINKFLEDHPGSLIITVA